MVKTTNNTILAQQYRASNGWCSAILLLAAAYLSPAQGHAQSVTYAAPIVITQGGTYTGNYQSLSSGVACVRIATTAPVILDGCNFSGAGNLVESGEGANLTIRNCTGQGLTPSVNNQAPGRFLDTYKSASLTIEHNSFTQTSGIVVNRWSGQAGQTLTVRYNRVRNVDGRWTNGGFTRSSFVQLNTVTQLAGVDISYNEVINTADQSLVEDNINLYNSSGTAQSPLHVHDNFVRGAYPFPATSNGFTGTGMTTDGDASTLALAAGYIEADHNQFVSTGNAAMNLAAGHDVYYHDNRAVTSGYLPDGRRFNAGYAALGVFNYYNQPVSVYFNNRVENNTVGYVRWGGSLPYQDRQDLSPGACAPCTGTISLPNPITTATEDAEATLWQQKVQQAGVTIGPLGSSTTPPVSTTGPILNPGFELDGAAVGSPTGWLTQTGKTTNDNADYTEASGGAHSGTYHGTHYRPSDYEVYTYQVVTNLPNGTYQLSAWVKSSSNQAQLKAQNFGGAAMAATIAASPSTWVQVKLPGIVVNNGQCEIGFYSNSPKGEWLHFDDVELVAQAANTPPTVTLAASSSLTLGQPLTLTATAADADGSISKVEFYNGTTLLGTDTAAPYVLSWTPTTIGLYSLTAKATDNSGATTTAAPVAVLVALPVVSVPTSSTVINPGFELDGADVASPTGWLTTGPNADADYTEAYGGAHSGTYHGTHWRTAAYEVYTYQTLTGLTNGTYKFSAWIKSDGGQPVAQLQAKNYGGSTLTAAITNTSGSWVQVSVSGINVTNGQCEIGFYSQALAYQWFYFDDVTFAPQPNVAPTVTLAASSSLTLGQPLTLTATAADADGSISKVEFYNGTTLLGTDTAAPYVLSWTPTAIGLYSLTAKATDNSGATTTAAPVAVTVVNPVTTSTAGTVVNPGFELDGAPVSAPTGWLTTGLASADYTETYGGAHTGTYHGSHYSILPYEVYTYQTVTGLASGTYKFSAWVKSTGNQTIAQLRAKTSDGTTLTGNVTATNGNWVLVEVGNIAVTNGQCEIGFYSLSIGGQYLFFDDVTFTVQATTPVATATVLNASFDDDQAAVQSPSKWLTQTGQNTNDNADYTEAYPGAHSGTYHGTHYRPEAYEVYTYQVVTGLANGTYQLSAWVKSAGGQSVAQLQAKSFGGNMLTTSIAASPVNWVQVTISGIVVSNGQCEVGLYSQAKAGQWLYFDDVALVQQSSTSANAKLALTPSESAVSFTATDDAEAVQPKLYPNPANNQVAITSTFDKAGTTTLVITDLQGVVITKYTRQTVAGDNQFTLNTDTLPNGLYLLRIEGNKSSVQRLAIQH